MLGRDLQVATGVMLSELADPLRGANGEVITNTGGHEHAFHTRNRSGLAIQPDQRRMISAEVVADVGEHARWLTARGLDLAALACHAIHVRRRPTEVADDAVKAGCVIANALDLAQDRAFGATLD